MSEQESNYHLGTLGLHAGQEVYALIKAVSLDRHSVGFA